MIVNMVIITVLRDGTRELGFTIVIIFVFINADFGYVNLTYKWWLSLEECLAKCLNGYS